MQLQNDGMELSMIPETPAKFCFINRSYRLLFIFLRYISVRVIRRGSEIKKISNPGKNSSCYPFKSARGVGVIFWENCIFNAWVTVETMRCIRYCSAEEG